MTCPWWSREHKKTLKISLLFSACLYELRASDNLFPWLWIGNHRAGANRQECHLIGQTSEISAQTAAVSQEDNHHLYCRPAPSHWTVPDGLLPYSSAGNAVPPHCVPYGSDITRGIRHARRKCACHWGWSLNKVRKAQNCINSPLKRATKRTVCAHSNPDHKLHPTSFTFHRKLAGEKKRKKNHSFRC